MDKNLNIYPNLQFPGLKPCATISVMPTAFAEINSVGMTDFVDMEFIPWF